jgi:hypothetical protein
MKKAIVGSAYRWSASYLYYALVYHRLIAFLTVGAYQNLQ